MAVWTSNSKKSFSASMSGEVIVLESLVNRFILGGLWVPETRVQIYDYSWVLNADIRRLSSFRIWAVLLLISRNSPKL